MGIGRVRVLSLCVNRYLQAANQIWVNFNNKNQTNKKNK